MSQSKSDALLNRVGKGDIKDVEKLLSEGADVNYINKKGQFALYNACSNGDADMIALLLKNKAQIDLKFKGWSSLTIASYGNHIAVVELLLKNNANVDSQNNDGASALHISSEKGHDEVVKLLLENGAKVDLQRKDGASALYITSRKGHVKVAKLLLDNGAKVDLQKNGGASALYIASQKENVKVSKLLLEYNAKIDLQKNDGYSPLMIVCELGLTAVTQVLLDNNADTYLRNNKGQTALEIAKENNHVDIISLFAKLKEKAAYPGILFSEGVKKESITSDEKTVNLEEVGIFLTFPGNSLPSTEPPVEVAIQPCFSGSFIMPDGIESMSPAYVINPNRKVVFQKDVVLKIQHYANLQTEEDCENMVFLTASSTPEYRGSNPVYVFKEITDTKGLFRPRQEKPLGEIQLKHFSIFGIGKRNRKNSGSKKGVKALEKLYSARLFKTEKSAVFCMCLYQPLYMQCCETVIASKYTLNDGRQGPIQRNAVTLSSEEVTIKANGNNDWRTVFTQNPKISKTEIEVQEVYQDKFEELQRLGFPPRIDIGVSLAPVTPNPKPLELCVEGLNSECIFKLLPDDFITEVNTALISDAIDGLHEELRTQPESCSSNILAEATKMMNEMTTIESLLHNKKPTVTTSIVQTLERMECTGQQLRDAAQQEVQQFKVTYDIEMHIQAVNAFTKQLRVNYGANIKHTSGDTPECQAATQLFITNGANLMNSIKDVIKASKLTHALPQNQLAVMIPPPTQPHGQPPPQILPHFSTVTAIQALTLKTVMNELTTVSHEARRIGIQLGIPNHKIKQFEKDSDNAFSDIMDYWLKENTEVPTTWESLVNALESPNVGEVGLARFLRTKYMK